MIEQDSNIVKRASRLFRAKYIDKKFMQAWLASYTNRCQEIEDLLWSIITGMLLDNAVGDQLDKLGTLVGQSRISSDDDTYRKAIRARVRINISQGTSEDLIYVAKVMTDNATLKYFDVYPAQVVIEILDSISVSPSLLAIFLWETRASGVGFRLWYNVTGDNTFTFAYGVPEYDNLQGFGYAPDPSVGGYWATSTNPQPPYTFVPPFTPPAFDDGFDEGFQ